MNRDVCEHFNPVDLPCEKCSVQKSTLREAAQHQPVAWYHVPHPGNGISPVVSMYQQREPSLYGAVVPLYTAPPQRKPLTDEEIDELAMDEDGLPNSHLEFARAIERAHGIGDSDD